MVEMKVILMNGGGVTLPDEYQKALDWHPGDELILRLEEGGVRIYSIGRSIRHAQELVRHYVGEGRLLSEELMQERRAEAQSK
jgi:bifunctional DNA-binding transcriptional regulator/antitoxin component of YhaV-PrlF toxin-antitoxin module